MPTDEAGPRASRNRLAYVEHDGRVLVDDGDPISLPAVDDVDIDTRTLAERTLGDHQVVFAEAHLDEHPTHWPRKDDLVHDPRTSTTLRHAISASLFRPVVGVVVQHEDDVLLVNPARGVAEGVWTLPGGFVNAFEQPRDAARREVREETGVELEELTLETTVTYTHAQQPYPILGLGFTARPVDTELSPHEEEIAQARWTNARAALDDAHGLARKVLGELIGGKP